MRCIARGLYGASAVAYFATSVAGQDARPRPEDTEVWQPVPPVVTVAAVAAPAPPPSDAIILFDGSSLDA